MSSDHYESKTRDQILKENIELRSRLDEAEETLYAIQNGEIDAIVTPNGSEGPQVYTLESADTLYRNLVQEMVEGVATLTIDSTILYGNAQLASMLQIPLEKLMGHKLNDFILSEDLEIYNSILNKGLKTKSQGEIRIKSINNTIIPVNISANTIKDSKGIYIVITNLSEHKHHESLKIAHENLKESEHHYRQLFTSMTEMFEILELIYDNNGKVIDYYFREVNPAVEKVVGKSKEELIDKRGKDIFNIIENYWLEFYDRVSKTGKPEHFENYRSGLDKYYSVTAWKIKENQIAVIFTDVTKRKKAQKEYKERNDKFRALFENSIDAVLLTKVDGNILDVNVAAEKIFGYNKEEMIKLGRNGIVDTNDPNLSVLLSERTRTGRAKGELRLKRKDGTIFPAEISNSVYNDIKGNKRTSMIIRDITRRKQAEEDLNKYRGELERLVKARTYELENAYESLKISQEHYLTLFNSIDEGFCTIEVIFNKNKKPVDYRYLEMNPAFEKLTGLTDAKGKLMRDITLDFEENWYEKFGEIALTGKPMRFVNKVKILNKWFDVYAFKIGVTKSQEVAVLFNDITQFKETEKKLKEYQHSLEEKVEKRTLELTRSNSELEHFAYVASHDMREPLRMITSFLQLLEKQYTDKLDQNAHEYIDFAVDGAKRLNNMINDLLEYSQVKSMERELVPVDTEEVLKDTLINLKMPIEESKAIITHDPLPTIIGDKEILIQLFQNLISNSIKYRSDETPKIHISAKEEQDNHRFSVHDNGIGMELDHLERIFTIFQRLHSNEEYEGTGIGLAIAQKIVHQLGGQIWVESEKGKGSTFYFTIPNRDGEFYNHPF